MSRVTENIRLGAPFGVPLAVQGLVLALMGIFGVFGLVTKNVGQAVWFPLLYASIFVHELAHALSTKALGGRVEGIVIHLVGGLTYSRGLRRPWASVLMTAAGPAASLGLGLVLWFVALPALEPAAGEPGIAWRIVFALMFANLLWGVFNILPIFPMDGGQILHTILERRLASARATQISALVSLLAVGTTAVLALAGVGFPGTGGLGSGMLLMFLFFFGWVNVQRWRAAAQAGAQMAGLAGGIGHGGRNGNRTRRTGPSEDPGPRAPRSLRDLADDPEHMRRLLQHGVKVGLGGLTPVDRRLVMLHRTMLETALTRSGFDGLDEEQRELLALHHDMEDRAPPH